MSNTVSLLEKARVELGEDEYKKQQGCEQLKSWIKSQPNIKNCRKGQNILLILGWAKDCKPSGKIDDLLSYEPSTKVSDPNSK
jgi:hypothetical protein